MYDSSCIFIHFVVIEVGFDMVRRAMQDSPFILCRTCRHQMLEHEKHNLRNCPLCHNPLNAAPVPSATLGRTDRLDRERERERERDPRERERDREGIRDRDRDRDRGGDLREKERSGKGLMMYEEREGRGGGGGR